MAAKTNCTINGKRYYMIYRKVGKKKNKNGVWVDDRKKFYGASKKDAEKKYSEYMEAKERRSNPLENMTMGQAIDIWVENFFNHCNLADTTKALYYRAYKNHFETSDICNLPLHEVTAYHLQTFYNEKINDVALSSLSALHKFLGHFYKHLELSTAGALHDITRPVQIPKKIKPQCEIKQIDTWTDDDLKKVINALRGTTLCFLVILAANTGLRISEIRALRYDDISADGILTVNKQVIETSFNGKSGVRISDTKSFCSNRTIPLPHEIMMELETHKRLHREEMKRNGYITDCIFTTCNGRYYWKSNIYDALYKVYDQLGVKRHPFHSFRKTYLTNLRRAGVDLEIASRLAGHSSTVVTAQFYIGVDDETKRTANENILQFGLKTENVV